MIVFALALGAPAAASAATPIAGQYIVVLKGGSGKGVAAEHARSANARVLQTYDSALHGYAAKLSDAGLAEVKADPRVASVTQDASGSPITGQMLPTGVNRIDADMDTQRSGDGTGAVDGAVAVFDTGVDTSHPDLNVAGGVNCVGPPSTYNDGTISDQYGHGTHVAGILGAKDDGVGVVGVAPGVRIYSVRDLDSRATGTISMQLCGIDWVTNNSAALGIKVANSSQIMLTAKPDDGNCGYSNGDVLHQAICRSTAAGITWVFGAGNNGTVAFTNGAGPNYREVLTTTAAADSNGTPNVGSRSTFSCTQIIGSSSKSKPPSETDDKYASFSSYASSTNATQVSHTVAAPGQCIWSTFKGGTYGYLNGTSMAAPHATGTVELCIVAGQCTGTPAEIIQKIRTDAQAYNQANPFYGFTGDPLHSPVSGHYYGYLLRPGLY
ncbi:MAG TPA: S8 family serine peptidase [Thermoleophilaceae bacterium]|nr:S8 family serine peptidase [Thermoleophilaceae bacterium]